MKYAKRLGLVALAALALTAVIGAGTASAKVCSTAGVGTSCGTGHGNEWTGEFHAVLTPNKPVILTSGFINVTCTSSTVNGKVTNSATGAGEITALTFGSCTDNISGNACTPVVSEGTPWAGTVHSIAGTTNGRMTVTDARGSFTCSPFGSAVLCKYTAANAGGEGEITVTGSDTDPEVDANKVKLTKVAGSDPLCSSNATWSGEYTVTTPTSLFIT